MNSYLVPGKFWDTLILHHVWHQFEFSKYTTIEFLFPNKKFNLLATLIIDNFGSTLDLKWSWKYIGLETSVKYYIHNQRTSWGWAVQSQWDIVDFCYNISRNIITVPSIRNSGLVNIHTKVRKLCFPYFCVKYICNFSFIF